MVGRGHVLPVSFVIVLLVVRFIGMVIPFAALLLGYRYYYTRYSDVRAINALTYQFFRGQMVNTVLQGCYR